MSEQENAGLNWLKLMGLALGDQVLIVSRGGTGTGFGGTLIEAVVGPAGPILIIIQEAEGTARVNIPWDAIAMITLKPPGTPGLSPPPTMPGDISVADLAEMAEKMGLPVPEQIQAVIDAEAAAGKV